MTNFQWLADLDPQNELKAKDSLFFRYSSTIPLKEIFSGESDDEEESYNSEEHTGLHGNRYSASGSLCSSPLSFSLSHNILANSSTYNVPDIDGEGDYDLPVTENPSESEGDDLPDTENPSESEGDYSLPGSAKPSEIPSIEKPSGGSDEESVELEEVMF